MLDSNTVDFSITGGSRFLLIKEYKYFSNQTQN